MYEEVDGVPIIPGYPNHRIVRLDERADSESSFVFLYHGMVDVPTLGPCYVRVENSSAITVVPFIKVSLCLLGEESVDSIVPVQLRNDVYRHTRIRPGDWTNICFPDGVISQNPIVIPLSSREGLYLNWIVQSV